MNHKIKWRIFHFTMLVLLLGSCENHQQSTNTITDSLIVGKWQMVEYGSGSVNALDTISFYENGKMDYPFETGEFTYRFIASDSLAITIDVKNQLMKEGQGFNGDKKMGVEETKKTFDAQEHYYQAVEAASIRFGGGKWHGQTIN